MTIIETAQVISDYDLITAIANRAVDMSRAYDCDYDMTSAVMDLESAHEGLPIDLKGLLEADDNNFAHDVFGIRRHLDRSTFPGKLTDCFVPRYAR